MTKEQKIQEVYESHGFSWIQAKEYVDENGWSKHRIGNCKALTNKRCGVSWRPEELYGLDKNNGWNKIESENDLPITNGKTIQYFFVTKAGNITENGYCDLMKNKRIQYSLVYTHYQQIIKPEKPLY